MKTIDRIFFFLFLSLALTIPLTARAVSYSPFIEEHRQIKNKAIMKVGTIIYLFHSGTPDVKNEIHLNDILIVYRESPTCEMKAVGKIKVLSFAGGNHITAEVIEGEIMIDDIAKKGKAAYLVVLTEDTCK